MPIPQYERLGLSLQKFIRTELETGITFASVALASSTEEKRQRTRQNARKAYDTAMHFWREHAFAERPAPPDLLSQLAKLKHLLLQPGETFEG